MGAVPSPSPDDHVQIGSVLDNRYRIDAVIGSGGMGRVYRAEHTALGRTVAIKVLHADLGRNKEAVTRFQREALASGRLDHPNIVSVSDFGVLDDGACFLVMEALEGEALGQRLDREKTVPWPEALQILRGVIAALRHAHDRGVVHRDIKPDNIFLAIKDGEPIVKILDFGIAKLYAGSVDDPATTRAGLTVGTPAYLSPEQAVGGEISPASDLYSATVVLFEMLTGRTPFDGKDPLAMLTAHVSKVPPRLSEVATFELPPGLDDLVAWGLQKMPVDRVGNAGEYLTVLEHIMGIQAPPSGVMRPVVATPAHGVITTPAPAAASQPVVAPPPSQPVPIPVAPATERSAPMSVTPVPGSHATPHPLLAPMAIRNTPMPSPALVIDATKSRDGEIDHDRTTTYTPPTAAPVVSTPNPTRAISLAEAADNEPIPRRWLYISVAVLVIAAIAALTLALTSHSHEPPTQPAPTDEPAPPPPSPPVKKSDKPKPHAEAPPSAPEPKQVTVAPPQPVDEAKLAAAQTMFEKGRSCKDRKAAFEVLITIDDPRVLPLIKKLGHRWHDTYLGLSHDDYNACFGADVDAFLKGK